MAGGGDGPEAAKTADMPAAFSSFPKVGAGVGGTGQPLLP